MNMSNEVTAEFYFRSREKVDLIIDSDTYNEIDDQFMIAYALSQRDRLQIKGFTCAPFRKTTRAKTIAEGMQKSYEEVVKVLSLADCMKIYEGKIFRGAVEFLPDEETFVQSDACDFIVETSKNYSFRNPLYVVATGACTNVASAILKDPTIVKRICVVWLGGDAFSLPVNDEYNMKQDIAGARVLIESGVPFVQLPAQGVVSNLVSTKYELTHWLKGKNPLCDYLLENAIMYVEKKNPYSAWSKIIWDIAAPAWILNDDERFMKSEIVDRKKPTYGTKSYETTESREKMCYVYSVNRDAVFSDVFGGITKL